MKDNSDPECKPNQKAASKSLLESLPKSQKIGSVSSELVSAASLKFDNICFDNVCFAYPSRPDAIVLDSFSFSLRSGQTIGIVGPSGSGVRQCCMLLCFFAA